MNATVVLIVIGSIGVVITCIVGYKWLRDSR